MLPEEWTKTIVGFATSTLGFFVALVVNSYVELRRDKKAFRAMLQTIKAEAGSNKVILTESFMKYYRKGLVLREFSLEVVAQCCSNVLFIKHVKPADLNVLNAYLRTIRLANSYRAKAEWLRLQAKEKESPGWLDGLIDSWDSNLKQCEADIHQVLQLTES